MAASDGSIPQVHFAEAKRFLQLTGRSLQCISPRHNDSSSLRVDSCSAFSDCKTIPATHGSVSAVHFPEPKRFLQLTGRFLHCISQMKNDSCTYRFYSCSAFCCSFLYFSKSLTKVNDSPLLTLKDVSSSVIPSSLNGITSTLPSYTL